MKKLILICLLVSVLFVSGCTTSNPSNPSNENVNDAFELPATCTSLDNCPAPCRTDDCTQICDVCESGQYFCMVSVSGDASDGEAIKRCAQCFQDRHCKTGYGCEDYLCVLE